jgi:hypothetical protein
MAAFQSIAAGSRTRPFRRRPRAGEVVVSSQGSPRRKRSTTGGCGTLTVHGNNDHDFYAIASDVGILVHNCGSEDLNYKQIRERIDSHTWSAHGLGTEAEGTKFAEISTSRIYFKNL